MSDLQDAFRLGASQHFSAFLDRAFREVSPADEVEISWYLQAIAYQFERCSRREIRRLIINIPPRHGKSISASVAFIAWLLGHDPRERVVAVSYAADLALKFARDTRRIMESRWYGQVFPGTRLGGRAAAHDFETTKRGSRYTTSIDGALTGLGGNVFIIDDPNPASDAHSAAGRQKVIEWYQNTLLSRANNARKSVIIVIQQRVHVDDLSGYLLENEPDNWVHLNLSALAMQESG